MDTRTRVIDDPEQMAALAHPARLRILDALRKPDSAAGVARRLGEPRQRVRYHVVELEKAGLLRAAGERRKGNFVERLFEAPAGSIVLSPRLMWDPDGARVRAVTEQVSLESLVRFGEDVQADATALLDRAAFDGERIASAAVRVTVRLPDPEARAAFLDEYLAVVRDLIERHATEDGTPYTVGLVAHPKIEGDR